MLQDTGRDMNGQAPQIGSAAFALARVDASTDFYSHARQVKSYRFRALNGSRRSGKCRDEAVPSGVDRLAVEGRDAASNNRIVAVQ